MNDNKRSCKPMLVGEIISQAVKEGRLLKSVTKDIQDYGKSSK